MLYNSSNNHPLKTSSIIDNDNNLSPLNSHLLSSPQQIIWLDQIIHPDAINYNLGFFIGIDGEFNQSLFIQAFEIVAYRHEALRLYLTHSQPFPVQAVSHSLPATINIHDFSQYVDAEYQAKQYIEASFIRQFNLYKNLWCSELLHVNPERHYWLFYCHHIILDGTSLSQLIEEVLDTYNHLLREEKPDKTAPAYLDFIADNQTYLTSQRYLQDLQFWLKRYEILPPPLLTPIKSNKTKDSIQAKPIIWQVDQQYFQLIEKTVAQRGLSTLHFMYAVIACYFSKTTGLNDIVIGTPIHNRKNARQKITMGMFASVIPIGVTLSSEDTFLDVMHKAAEELHQCYKHQRVSIAEINQQTCVQQKTGRSQLFDVVLSFEPFKPNLHLDKEGTYVNEFKVHHGVTYPLSVIINQYTVYGDTDNQPVTVEFSFSTDYFSEDEIRAIQSRFAVLIDSAMLDLETPVAKLPILPQEERQRILVDFNAAQWGFNTTHRDLKATHQKLPHDTLIHSLFEAQVQRTPDATALIFEEQTISYRELNQRANRLAHELIAKGVHPDDRVAICVERSLDMITGLFGILKAGGAYVPLDPNYPAERLAYILDDASPVILLTQTHLHNHLFREIPIACHLAVIEIENVLTSPAFQADDSRVESNPSPQVLGLNSHHLCYVIYTSGSTGQPKGAMVEHRHAMNLHTALKTLLATAHPCRITLNASIVFDASVECWLQLLSGHTLVIVPEFVRKDSKALWHYFAHHAVDIFDSTPAQLTGLLREGLISDPDYQPRLALIGGEAIPPAIWALLQRSERPRFINMYGLTECAVNSSACLIDNSQTIPNIGHPLDNTQIYILDRRDPLHGQNQPVPIGVIGEIYLAGESVGRGYLNRPELTSLRFLPDPFSDKPEVRMYKTGDLGRWLPNGTIEYLGRDDFQVKLRGFRIELGEIEARLVQCSGVNEAVVIAREDSTDEGISGQKRLVAYVIAQPHATLNPIELHQQLAQNLVEYMLPSAFVILERFPLTPNGKLNRQALPAPDQSATVTRSYAAPVNEIEVILAEIWQTLFGIEKVGRNDHFFELGGHSLSAVQLAARVNQRLARKLTLQQVFDHPVLAGLASILADEAIVPPIAIPTADYHPPLPLSFAQQRLWFLAQFNPAASLAYHIPLVLRLNGKLNLPALSCALNRLVARQESLRTHFVLDGSQPCLHIDPECSNFPLLYHDLRELDDVSRLNRLNEQLKRDAQTPFDFAQAPLIRGQLLRLADEEYILNLTQHHIIADGWSVRVLLRDLSTLYRAELAGHADPLSPLPVQYAHYAIWQREWLQDDILMAQRDFWQKQLQGAPALLTLTTDRPRSPEQHYIGSHVPIFINANTLAALKTLGQRQKATLFMTLLAAWSIVLARLSGQNDIVIGTPVANRPRRELEELIGFFINTLPLRVELEHGKTVAELLTHVRERVLSAFAHQDLPFEQLVDALQPERSLSYSPIFQVMLDLGNISIQPPELPDLSVSLVEQTYHSIHFDLKLSLTESADGLHGTLEYALDLFERATVERIAGYFTQVLTAMTRDEMQLIAHLPILPATERQQLLVDFNANQTDFSSHYFEQHDFQQAGLQQHLLINRLFEEQVQRTPDAIAATFEDQSISYSELNRRANYLAHHLIGLGIRPDDCVAICVERSLIMMVGLLAILKAGSAYVPLDPSYPKERLAYMLNDAEPIVLLTQSSLIETWDTPIPTILLDDLIETLPASELGHAFHNPDVQALGLTPHHLAYVIYTSGSTGQPKGVMVEHHSVCNYLLWALDYGLTDQQQDGIVSSPIAFDATVTSLYLPLLSGGKVHLLRDGQELVDLLPAMLAMKAGALIKITPSHLAAIGQEFKAIKQKSPDYDLPRHCFVVAGETLSSSTVALWRELSPESQIINEYGPTETVVGCTIFDTHQPSRFVDNIPIGHPIANTQIYVLDANGEPTPLGVAGELHIGGAGVARGYLKQPELTAERFLPDPFADNPAARMYKTGDLGRWLPDGTIEYLGRNDFQVKLRGFRIELGEIEARLQQYPGVRKAVVVVHETFSKPDDNISHQNSIGQKRLIAYLLTESETKPDPAEVRQRLSQQLADYMIPSAFVILDHFPLTPNGKLDRQALPVPDQSAFATRDYAAPLGEVETMLAEVWQTLLGLPRISRHDHFFELGGHSLMIVSMIEQLRMRGWTLDLRTVFTAPILADMATQLLAIQHENGAFTTPPNRIPDRCNKITPEMLTLVTLSQSEIDTITSTLSDDAANIQDIYPLAPLQEGILFHHLLQTQGDIYLLRNLFAFDSQSRLEAFLAALQQVIDRHDILRTAFCWQQLPQPVQVVWRHALLRVDTFKPVGTQDIPSQLLAYTDPQQRRLDITQAPLFAADIAHDTQKNEWLLALSFHHLISDNMTLRVLIHEIRKILQHHDKNRHSDHLPELSTPLPYRQFIAQTLNVPASEHEAYFREMLADVETPTAPFGIMDVRNDNQVKEHRQRLDAALSRAIRTQARRQGVNPSVLFHVAWAQVLAKTSGQDDVVFGTVLLGRMKGNINMEHVMGLFINTLPIRISLANHSVHTVVQATYHTLPTLMEHEQAPLSLAQGCSGVEPPLPLFSTLLNYRHSQTKEIHEVWEGIRLLQIQERTNYPIALSIDDFDDDFGLVVQAVPDIDPIRLSTYMITALTRLVDALKNNPQQWISDISILPPAEYQQLTVDFNATQTDYPLHALVHQLFEDQVQRTPDAIALVFETQSISYDKLNRRANRLAHHLMALGVRPDDRVAICAERSPEMVVGLLAILKAGGAYVPLSPNYPVERLAYMLTDAQPVAILIQTALPDTLASTIADIPTLVLDIPESVSGHDSDHHPAEYQYPEHNPDPQAVSLSSHHLAYVVYTSGSTGRPKGVMVEHRNILSLITNNGFSSIGNNDCIAHCANVSFDATTWEIWAALLHGARLHIVPQDVLLDPIHFCESLVKGQVSALWLTTGLFNEYLETLTPLFSQLRYLIVGGEVLEPRKIQQLRSAGSPTTHVINAYGPTETTTFAAMYEITFPIDMTRSIPIGRPIANTQIYILDSQGHPTPLGVVGEIHIAGSGVSRGYLNQPELTAERFLPDPFSKDGEARMYKSGDLGCWLADGNIEYAGRNDFQVKLRGFRIEPGEIEVCLTRCHGVREARVIARDDENGQKQLVAYLLMETNLSAEPEKGSIPATLRQQLSHQLADYMIPSAFVILDSFPLTPNGKLDRQALPAPDQAAIVTHGYEAPNGEIEATLAQIWRELLGVEQVGRHDHFFELGGHSLMVMSLIEQLRARGWHIALRDVFTTPVLADIARMILTEQRDTASFTVPPNLIPEDCTAITPEMLPLINLSQDEIDTIAAAIPKGAANIQDIYPLAPLQEGMLFHHQLQTQGDIYLLRHLLAFDSRQRLDAFLVALQCVIDRHDILRTAFYWQGLSQPVQVVWRQAPLHINTFMPTNLTVTSGGNDIRSQLLAHTDPQQRRLDLNQAPLFAAEIAHDPHQQEWLLSLSFHHLINDHMAMERLLAEIHALLPYHCKSHPTKRLPPALPYRNFVAQSLSVPAAVHETYFNQILSDVETPTAPFGIVDIHTEGRAVSEVRQPLDATLAQAIRTQARRQGVSPSILFHVAWAQVLAKLSGQDDVVFGTVLLGRMQGDVGTGRTLGLFLNTLPLRISLTGLDVHSAVQATHRNLTALLEHEQAPLVLAQRCSGIIPPLPLFSALLNYRHSQPENIRLTWEGMRLIKTAAKERTNYPLTFTVDDFGEAFQLVMQTVQDIDPARLHAYAITALTGLVEALETAPQRAIMSIPILPAAEYQQLVEEFSTAFNDTPSEIPQADLIHTQFESQVQRTPDATAICFRDDSFNDYALSYAELNRRANRLAHHLIALGVRPDNRVVICAERSPEWIIGLLAILKAGGAYVPLDPTYPAERLAYMLEDAAPVAILMQSIHACRIKSTTQVVYIDTDAEFLATQPTHNPAPHASELTSCNLACVIYTSGSTGQPKGVMVEHRSVLRLAINNGFADIGPDDCVAHCANIAFDASTWEIWSTLLNGGHLHVVPQSVLLDPARLCESLRGEGTTALWLTVGLFNEYLDYLEPLYPQLRYLIIGGDTLDPSKIRHMQSLPSQPAHLINGYGPTETTTFATTYTINDPIDVKRSIPIGRPIANTRIYILDSYGQPVPIGVTGEIYIAGIGVARGYLNHPELTVERFIADPFSSEPGVRMYKTGDLGCWLPDGNIEYAGRNDFQIKLRGFRIEPGEIEAYLNRCDGVHEAVVLARINEGLQKHLVAYIIAEQNAQLNPADLRRQLAKQLADYMIPSAFVVLDAFPLTPHGKLDRQALPMPDKSASVIQPYEAPSGKTETALARIWQKLLKMDSVGRYDNFFELGGHSLVAMQLLARMREQNMEIPLATLLAHPTLHELALAVSKASFSPSALLDTSLVPLSPSGDLPPLFLVHEPSGDPLVYSSLATLLPSELPVYALQALGLHALPKPPASIEALAAYHIKAIRRVQPHGPYHLAGWSMGGVIAYEIAQQLINDAEEVAFLGMIDSVNPCLLNEQKFHFDGGKQFLNRYIEHTCLPVEMTQADFLLRSYTAEFLVQLNTAYVPPASSLPIHLYTADGLFERNEWRGWQGIVGDSSVIHPIGGTHYSIMQSPLLNHVADSIASIVSSCQKTALDD
ncbi:non-ribosomal peptide synthetase [Xenorhabdus santafensis]|uniref:non-ribosomal peptide synthetase n=1 Tax=Xenorhabdus santafensis TaxID=2582833 RepID=UPI0029E7DB73|nr:non-ribosomal peptide synthetase [Xenorhabdus sp. 12]